MGDKVKGKLVVIEDDALFCNLLRRHLEGEYDVAAFTDPKTAVDYLIETGADVVLTDLHMPGLDGIGVLETVKAEVLDADVVIMTAYAKVDSAIEAMKKGAYDYIIKPFVLEELSLLLKNVFEKRRLFEENVNLKSVVDTQFRPENITGESEAMKAVYRTIELVSCVNATVLLTGESGTGKELVARAIHFLGNRKEKKFVSFNCSAIPDSLLEAELFGFAKGAFSGAYRDKKGLLEYADGGTVFLDEIADASLAVQSKFLRFLQERKFRRLGGGDEIQADIRVICATNRDVHKLIKEGLFREDLYFRINVVTIQLPPLRERREDIPFLIKHFLEGRKAIDPEAVDVLCRYFWPGNVRELKNFIDRAVILVDSDTIKVTDIPEELGELACANDESLSYNEAKQRMTDRFNNAIINKYLLKYNGNVGKAAKDLAIDRANFQRLMRKYNISARKFKATH